MPRRKYHRNRIFQEIGEPGPGSIFVGYVRYSSELQNETSIVTQKRLIQEYAQKKGWKLVRWYEEPEESAKYDRIEDRPVFAQLLKDAATGQFQVVICAFSKAGGSRKRDVKATSDRDTASGTGLNGPLHWSQDGGVFE